ncbi:MAG: ABC transporter permease [Methanobacteriota archaeon]|nr:MAG: ABC transporter permease [Euryarchaeota archaeon]
MSCMESSIHVSGSEAAGSSVKLDAIRFFNAFKRSLQRSYALFRGSRLGLTGLTIVLIFAAIGILAPIISPYPRSYEAPDSDRFTVSSYSRNLTLRGLNYSVPVMGPTTPLQSDRLGGMWLVNYAREGYVFMDFTEHTLETNVSPFQAGNRSLQFHISDLPVSPQPVAPLEALYFVVPALDSTKSTGPRNGNGAIAFFAQRDFYVYDPFTRSLIFRWRLGFDPSWTGEDPASSGDLITLPAQFTIRPFPGAPGRDVGPYRYFFASDGTHTVVFETVFVHTNSTVQPGAVYPGAPGGQPVLFSNETLSAPPFVYYNKDTGELNSSTNFRTGRGQTILLPLANGSLEVHNVDGSLFGWVPLRLAGQPATVTGTIGFTRSTSIDTMKLYLPVRSSSATGVAVLDAASMKIVREFSVPDPTWEPVGIPTSYRAQTVYLGLYDHNEGPDGTTHMIRLNETAVENLQFRTDFPGRVRTFFEVDERSKVFVFPAHGGISMLATTSRTDAHVAPEPFAITPPSNVSLFRYAGALGGTLYGTALIPQELYGVWTDASEGETTLFQLLGTVRTPLPPGTYPSGNHYVLGTDFRGADILTQLFYGTQVAFIVGGLAAVFAVGLGTLVGLIAGFFGKLVDTLLMRTTDIFLVLPFLPIVLILASILRPSIWVIILVLGIIGWPGIARVIRAQVLTIKERPFVDAARVSGASDLRLIFFQVAPNVLPFSFLYMSLTVAGAIITEAALSFLGLGDASVISWGGMLSQVLTFGGALTAWWWLFPPGLAITLLSLGFYLLGRGFDEIINPRLRRR